MTFPTGVIDIRKCSDEELKTMKCSDEELKTMLDEAREASKHSRKLGRVVGIIAAHRLQQVKDLLTFEKLVNWRRMNGFDRVADGENNWFHGPRSLPPTPEKFAADLWCEVNALKNAISMPSQKVSILINAIEQGKVSDEKFAILKRLVEKRGREAAQVLLRQWIPYSTVAPVRLIPNLRQMYVLSSRVTRVRWARSWRSSNHHQLVRVSKRPDSSVPRTRGYGSKDEPPPTAS